MCYATFRTIVSEVRQFVDTYPLTQRGESVGVGDEPHVAVVQPHIIVFWMIPHMSMEILLGGMKELM